MAAFRLAATAAADIVALLAWSEDRFDEITRRRYEMLLVTGLRDVAADPERRGSIPRPELGPAVRSYHLRHSLERARTVDGFVRGPRHLLLYRALVPDRIGIGRVRHDAMEIERHVPPDYGDGLKELTRPHPHPGFAHRFVDPHGPAPHSAPHPVDRPRVADDRP